MKLRRALTEAIDAEFSEATRKLAAGDALHAFTHLERAHVLGQKLTTVHAPEIQDLLAPGRRI